MKVYFFNFLTIGFCFIGIGCGENSNDIFQPSHSYKKFTLEDIYLHNKFSEKSLSQLQWAPDGKRLLYLNSNSSTKDVVQINQDFEKNILVEGSKLILGREVPIPFDTYLFSPKGDAIIFTGLLPSRGFKTGGTPYLYDLKKKTLKPLGHCDGVTSLIQFSPDATKVGFVCSNDLYSIDRSTEKQTRLTFSGSDTLLNGVLDWVYEEEFGIISGWQWSPDSHSIAFWQLDQAQVPLYPILDYKGAHPDIYWMRYPKAGDPNAKVSVGIISLNDAGIHWVHTGFQEEHYIPRFNWTPDSKRLFVQVLNRQQNQLSILSVDKMGSDTKVVLIEKNKSWVDVTDNLFFLNGEGQFVWSSERDGYQHLYLYNADGLLIRQLTEGPWEVFSVLGFNEKSRRVYFGANKAHFAEHHLYSVDLEGKNISQLTQFSGTHKVVISPQGDRFIDIFSNFEMAPQISVYNSDGQKLVTLEENLMTSLSDYEKPGIELFSFENSARVSLNGLMIKPGSFDARRKYPVLIHTYGGPGSQVVRNQYRTVGLWERFLTQEGYLIISVDNRGTGGRGKEFKSQVYRKLGEFESQDQIETAKYLRTLPFVDGDRIGIWGWSYGGYLSALSMAKGGNVFKTGIAVAPVGHWKYYDSIYTERYMGTPKDNPDGYSLSSPISYAHNLWGSLFIVHGTGDDNVHFQNSVSLIDAFIDHNKDVETLFYPNRTHGLSEGKDTYYHLFTKMWRFLKRTL